MKKLLFALMTSTIAMALGLGPASAADDDDAAKHFMTRARQINDATAKDPEVFQAAMKYIAVETGVPLEKVRAHHKSNPNMGAAGLLLANVMAAETKEPPANFLRERRSGDQWLAIARERKVPIEKLNVRLDNVWKAIAPSIKK